MPIECDDEYWEHPNPSRAFKQPAGKLSTVTFWVKYLELLEIFAFMHRTVVRLLYHYGHRKDVHTALVCC